jgi:hypothetical protein
MLAGDDPVADHRIVARLRPRALVRRMVAFDPGDGLLP